MIKQAIIKLLGKFGYQLVKIKSVSPQEVLAHKERGLRIIQTISPDFSVLQGPFEGLKYPHIDITEATLVPKIAGSYESQLNNIVEEIIKKGYSNIIDVGCAEGYYAVGFAKRMPATTIHAYDINKKDLEFCSLMAKENGVSNIRFGSFCSPQTLLDFVSAGRTLVFCDAEGYELELFTPEVISKLRNTDILVELHDTVNPQLSTILKSRFVNTHRIEIVNNRQTDLTRFFPKLAKLNADDKLYAVMEHRGGYNENCFMEWAYLTALQ